MLYTSYDIWALQDEPQECSREESYLSTRYKAMLGHNQLQAAILSQRRLPYVPIMIVAGISLNDGVKKVEKEILCRSQMNDINLNEGDINISWEEHNEDGEPMWAYMVMTPIVKAD